MSLITPESMVTFVETELRKVGGPHKQNAKYHHILCCFHNDSNPSLGVRVRHPTERYPIGSFKCLSCGASGKWNKLADRLNLSKISKDSVLFNTTLSATNSTSVLDQLLKVSSTSQVADVLALQRVEEVGPWPKSENWRGFHGRLLAKLGALKVRTRFSKRIRLWFPVYVEQALVGGILARLKPASDQDGNKLPSYLNSKGRWSQTHGLFPYDYVATMIEELDVDYVVLVEGPRDAIKLISMDIPALCVLGTESVTQSKFALIAGLADRVFVMGDGDEAGHKMNRVFKAGLKNLAQVKVLKIPISKEKYDPCSLPPDMLKRAITFIRKQG